MEQLTQEEYFELRLKQAGFNSEEIKELLKTLLESTKQNDGN